MYDQHLIILKATDCCERICFDHDNLQVVGELSLH